jgi:hypothetical protein
MINHEDEPWRSLPKPPPMRNEYGQKPKEPSDFGAIILTIIFSMAFGILCGWQMHGGACL